ncbi:MAG TPA: GNAT family N-acetyltransferase [Anaerolineales bacterium]|nr:GNAT family N-acetyltransferase [Anaerolineales bacterium]HRF47800.1 GNAT family N-acetyltransferase [Anaerolineales bacterium]
MPQLNIRPVQSSDLAAILAIDHAYSTDYVWQMEAREEGPTTQVTFRNVRLPRSVRVTLPRDTQHLQDTWAQRVCFLVAEEGGIVQGYLNLTLAPMPATGWIADLGVVQRVRRTGVGTVLLASAVQWARSNGLQRLILEMQSKNYPAICFAQKNGLVFCGYNDRYYPNQDVALYFAATLK